MLTAHRDRGGARPSTGLAWRGLVACAVAAAAVTIAACKSSPTSAAPAADDPDLLLVKKRTPGEKPIDVDRASREPAELLRAARVHHHRIAEVLGSHELHARWRTEVRDGDKVLDKLEVETTLVYRKNGDFRAVASNSSDYGREVIYRDGYLYLAPRYGKYHRRRPETPEEPGELRDRFSAELAGQLELLAPGIRLEPAGEADTDTDRAGRRAIAVTIARAEAPAAAGKTGAEASSERSWRASSRVLDATGKVFLDRDTGIVLEARLEAHVEVTRDGRPLVLAVSAEQGIDHIGEQSEIAAPEGSPDAASVDEQPRWADTPLRSREVDERDTLLRGIAPPSRRSARGSTQPAPSSGSAPGKKGDAP